MTQFGYALVGLTAMVAALAGMLTFMLMRVVYSMREARRSLGDGTPQVAMLSAALQEAVAKIKAQEQATSARADASDKLRGQIADSLMAGLLVVDARGRVEILNPAGRRLLHAATLEVGAHYREVLSAAQPLAVLVTECLDTGASIVRRTVAMSGDAKPSHLGVTVSPVVGPGDGRGVICLFSDLTNVVELEEQLRLKETLARLGELTAGIAHEFRNGLATIHGYSRLINPEELPVKYRPYLEGIRQEVDVMGKVVTNFLNFARPHQLSLAPVDVGVVARKAADDIRHELPAGTTIHVTGEFDRIEGDDAMLRQVFANLIRNAAEACESTGVAPAVVVRGAVDRSHRTCQVWVEDNGPGIPIGEREKVFRPFFTHRARGTGLGLAIVQKIVLTHDGRVSVDATPGGGASLQLVFRLSPEVDFTTVISRIE